jgi:DNA end-binding protein Ku
MPAATRPIWKGQLRLSLVAIDVELYTATKASARPSFRQIHEPSGKPVNYEKVVAGVGPVDKDEIMKGFEYEKGDFVLLTDKEIDAVKLDTRKTLELSQFVDASEIEPLYFEKPYWVVPADELAEDAFRVVRDALRKSGKVGLGQIALRGREYLVAIKPSGNGLLLETLRYEEEIRKGDTYFSGVSKEAADDELVDVAAALIEKKTAKFDPKKFKDHYQSALRELIARKLKSKGKRVEIDVEPAGKPATGGNVIDLMAALKKSLEGGAESPKKTATKAPAKPATKTTKKPAAKSSSRKKAS